MRFESRTDTLFLFVFAGVIFLMIGTSAAIHFRNTDFFLLLMVDITSLLTIILILWISYGTSYYLDAIVLKYRSGPFKGQINTEAVRKVIVGETQWSGLNRFGTARNGLIIFYNKFDELYITPSSNEAFLQKLLKVRSGIEVVYREKESKEQ